MSARSGRCPAWGTTWAAAPHLAHLLGEQLSLFLGNGTRLDCGSQRICDGLGIGVSHVRAERLACSHEIGLLLRDHAIFYGLGHHCRARFFLRGLGLCGPPFDGTITDVAFGLAVGIHPGIVPAIAVALGASQGIKTLGRDREYTGIYASATGFYVNHDICHVDIINYF
jgi:hypothetical protein